MCVCVRVKLVATSDCMQYCYSGLRFPQSESIKRVLNSEQNSATAVHLMVFESQMVSPSVGKLVGWSVSWSVISLSIIQ